MPFGRDTKKKEKKDEKAIANQVYVPPQYQKAV